MSLEVVERRLRAGLVFLALGLLGALVVGWVGGAGQGAGSRGATLPEVAAYFNAEQPHHLDVHRYAPYIFVDQGAPISVLRRHHYETQFVNLPTTFGDQALRVTLWDNPRIPTAVFAAAPGLTDLGRKDFIAWVSSGHNAVFLGGYSTLSAMNQLFGFELEYVPYREGPYWQNERNVRGTPFTYGPARLEETGQAYGVKIDSIPLTGYSMYDTNRDSLVFFIKYNQGTVCYVGATFDDLDESDPWGFVLRAAVRM